MFVIAGLGNPGRKYDNTRHNIGFIAMDYLAAKSGIAIQKIKHKALIGEGQIAGEKVLLVKPQTFMNLSGESIGEIMSFYKLAPEQLMVIYDDVCLDAGRIRIRAKGSDGGHNGMKSIIYHLQSDAFSRLRLGVGQKPPEYDLADWVLAKFNDAQIKVMAQAVDCVPDIITEWLQNGTASAMNRFNGAK